MTVIYTIIPQYVILIVSNVLLGMKSIYVLGFFAAIKLIISFFVRTKIDSNRVSVYRKKKHRGRFYVFSKLIYEIRTYTEPPLLPR